MLYPNLKFPKFSDRPFFYTNFVQTIDGKVGVKEEGYWPNVFSKKTALMRVINEINKSKRNLEIVWDCEFGFERNESGNIVIGDTVKFKDNKELIRNFLKNRNRNIEITTVEIPNYLFGDSLLGVFGLAFDPLEYYTKKNR